MIAQAPTERTPPVSSGPEHSDRGPSSKDWQKTTGEVAETTSDAVQPGTATEGRSWHSREPDPDDKDDKLHQALKDSFPASDPPQPAQPGVTGWDVEDETKKTAGG